MSMRSAGGRLSLLSGCVLLLAGCSSTPEEVAPTPSGLTCVDDSRHCIGERQAALQSMLGDRERRWVKEQATPHAYASGVRMFAYRSKKKDLSCDELANGRREADGAPGSLRGAGGQGLSPAQVSRGVMFAAEVGRELAAEQKRRC